MPRNPSMRASDVERDRVATELQEHCAQGRLTVEEFQERLDTVYSARTVGELDRLTEDLPEVDLYELPVPATQHSYVQRRGGEVSAALPGGIWPWLWGAWGTVGIASVALWLLLWQLTGHPNFLYMWWLYAVALWGGGQLAVHVINRRRRNGY